MILSLVEITIHGILVVVSPYTVNRAKRKHALMHNHLTLFCFLFCMSVFAPHSLPFQNLIHYILLISSARFLQMSYAVILHCCAKQTFLAALKAGTFLLFLKLTPYVFYESMNSFCK